MYFTGVGEADSRSRIGHPPDRGWLLRTTEYGVWIGGVGCAGQGWSVWVMGQGAICEEWAAKCAGGWGMLGTANRGLAWLMGVGRFWQQRGERAAERGRCCRPERPAEYGCRTQDTGTLVVWAIRVRGTGRIVLSDPARREFSRQPVGRERAKPSVQLVFGGCDRTQERLLVQWPRCVGPMLMLSTGLTCRTKLPRSHRPRYRSENYHDCL